MCIESDREVIFQGFIDALKAGGYSARQAVMFAKEAVNAVADLAEEIAQDEAVTAKQDAEYQRRHFPQEDTPSIELRSYAE